METKPVDNEIEDDDVIYTLRTAHQNQSQLNLMADQKANILVGVIVLVLTFLLTRLSTFDLTQLQFSLIIFFIVIEVIALFLGIMVIKPRTQWLHHSMKIEDMPNPLFFGFFTRFTEDQYIEFMKRRLHDNQSARELLITDIFQIGQVLRRKYTLLRFAYLFAVFGILFAVFSFIFLLANKI